MPHQPNYPHAQLVEESKPPTMVQLLLLCPGALGRGHTIHPQVVGENEMTSPKSKQVDGRW